MNTQNVNVKTATKESSERWVENRMRHAINEQKSLLARLEELKSTRMMADERAEQVLGTLLRMAENVIYPGMNSGNDGALCVNFNVAQPWLQAKDKAAALFGENGTAAWEIACKRIKDAMCEREMP